MPKNHAVSDRQHDFLEDRAPSVAVRRRTLLAVGASAVIGLGCLNFASRTAARPRHRRLRRNRTHTRAPEVRPVVCDPHAMSGIAGLVLIGPMCPVVSEDDPCPDRPFAATLAIRDEVGRTVCLTRSGNDGRFRVGLPPGGYELVPENGAFEMPYAQPQNVIVVARRYTDVLVSFDSGIR